ncbi:MAG TPA: cyclic nucleotide-binding domain-containing protein, partial [Stellaceae bacterium]|nr:cyclic nucleotide-binding domain-containing protein [Stellaceae bacterium]
MESGVITGGEEERGLRVADALPVALSSLPLFGGLAAEASAVLERELEWLSLLGGATLFAEGDTSDALYIVISGVLGVIAGDGRDSGTLLAQIHPGETVGEMALLSDRARSATIVALRDSTLLRVTKASFARLLELHPASMRFLTQLLVDRLDRTTHRAASAFVPRTLALIPLEAGVPIAAFAADLARALGEAGTTVKILDARAREDGLDKLHALEKLHNL